LAENETVKTLNLDEEGDPPVKVLQCFACQHLQDYEGKLTCRAFPEGIPDEILSGDFDHSNAYEGDNGIRFEPLEE